MTTYLAIITTTLVVTQIIRVIQNSIQLKKYAKTQEQNNRVEETIKKLDKALNKYLD